MNIRPSIWLVVAAAALTVLCVALWHGQATSRAVTSAKTAVQTKAVSGNNAGVVKRVMASVSTSAASDLCSPAVQLIVDASADYRQREQAIRTLRAGKLGESDRQALYDFLRQHAAADDGQPGQVLKNELLDALCLLQPPPAGLRELLTGIYQDGGQNLVLRDYAVQHLTAFYQQMAVAEVDAQARQFDLEQTRQTLWQALNDTGSSIAGTALLGLSQLAQQGWPGMKAPPVGEAALKLAGNTSASDLSRITALQVCATLRVEAALPVAWSAAQLAGTKSEQISAIATLGALGGSAQEDYLSRLMQGNDERLKLPAQRALNQIRERLQRETRAKSS